MKLKKVILTAAATAFILQASAYAADLTASYSMDDMTGLTYMGTVSNILFPTKLIRSVLSMLIQ